MVPRDADANVSIGKPKKLDDFDKALLEQVLDKYEQAPILPVIESLIAARKPIKGFSQELDAEYFVRKFLELAESATRVFDRNNALVNAAKILGHMNRQEKSNQAVNISFKMDKPADSEIIDDEFITER